MKRYAVLIGMLCLSSPIFATAFGAGSSLINVPLIKRYPVGKADTGVLMGLNSKQQYQFDYKFGFSITEYLNVGLVFIRANTVVANFQATAMEFPDINNLRLGFGMLNISADPSITSWENENLAKSNHLVHYLGVGFDFMGGDMMLGATKRREPSAGEKASILNSIFLGYSYPLDPSSKLLFESDGDALSFGYGGVINGVDWKIAFSSPMDSGVSNASLAFLSLQFQMTFDVFEAYNKEFSKLKRTLDEYEKMSKSLSEKRTAFERDIKDLQRSKEALNAEIDKLTTRTAAFQAQPDATGKQPKSDERSKDVPLEYANDAKSFQYYQKAQQFYASKQYYAALQELEKAYKLMPSQAIYPIQMGSIYFGLGDKDNAMILWTKAYRQDPEHPEFKKLPKELLEIIKRRVK
jgi:tetratricopeptide (TPR) repeat protein